MMILLPFLLIQPIFIIWIFYQLIKLIISLLTPNFRLIFENSAWPFLLICTSVIAPLFGFTLNASQHYQSPDSWGGDENFSLFAIEHLLEMAIFYFTTIAMFGICSRFGKHQAQAALFRSGLLMTLILLSLISSINLGPTGFMLSAIPILGLLLIAPVLNIFLFTALFLYHIKTSFLKQYNPIHNLFLGLIMAFLYITIFQLLFSVIGFDDFGLLKAFTQSKDGFIPKLFK